MTVKSNLKSLHSSDYTVIFWHAETVNVLRDLTFKNIKSIAEALTREYGRK
jgi:hypothetical protein